MNSNKSPGSDGFQKEFYEKYWDIFGQDLVEVLNNAFLKGGLSNSQREGIITYKWAFPGEVVQNGKESGIK